MQILALSLTLLTLVTGQNQRIINGEESIPFSHPWMVSLQRNGGHFCGGSLLDSTTVLTAAHCSQTTASSVRVSVHRHDVRKSSSSEQGISLPVKRIVVHPNYSRADLTSDVSIWKLANPVPSNITVAYINLDDGALGSQEGLNTIGLGWGKYTETVFQWPSILREAVLPIYNFTACNKAYGNTLQKQHHICAGYKEGKQSACSGDSGSPLFFDGNTQVGVASFVSGQGCLTPEQPAVYARVATYLDWIRQQQAEP